MIFSSKCTIKRLAVWLHAYPLWERSLGPIVEGKGKGGRKKGKERKAGQGGEEGKGYPIEIAASLYTNSQE